MRHFATQGLRFPKRAYGGVWKGQLVWGRLSEGRVLSALKNPAYAGVYAFGRYRCVKEVLADGSLRARVKRLPQSSWLVALQGHLVAAALEQRGNEALSRLAELQQQFAAFQREQARTVSTRQQAELQSLAEDFPRLWQAPSTPAKDQKRLLRLLPEDVTVVAPRESPTVVPQVRWQGGACEGIRVGRPRRTADRWRYPEAVVARVRELAAECSDERRAAALKQAGLLAAKGEPFTASKVQWVRYRQRIPTASLTPPTDEERGVGRVAEQFGVSRGVGYYWIERGILEAHKANRTAPYRIPLDPQKEKELQEWVRHSSRIAKRPRQEPETPL